MLEQYITYEVDSPLQDRQAEAILKTLLETAPKVLKNPTDYNTRANLCWCATQALNNIISCGAPQDWATHMIGHELTAIYGIAHAQSLAIVLPRLWKNRKEDKADKLFRYANRVLGISSKDKEETIDKAIQETESFFRTIGMKTKLSDYNINAFEAAEKIIGRFKERKTVLGEKGNITPEIVKSILLDC